MGPEGGGECRAASRVCCTHILLKICFKVSPAVCHKGLLNFPGSAEGERERGSGRRGGRRGGRGLGGPGREVQRVEAMYPPPQCSVDLAECWVLEGTRVTGKGLRRRDNSREMLTGWATDKE